MKLSEKILVIANWLSNENNEILNEVNDQDLQSVAFTFFAAAELLKTAAENLQTDEVQVSETNTNVLFTPEKIEEIAAIAEAFDASNDELLQKQASVLDEILASIGAPKDYIFNFKKAEEDKLDILKKKYKQVKEEQDKGIKSKEALDAINKSPEYKQYRSLEHSLNTRYCPDHPGVPTITLGEKRVQCSMDHKIYDFNDGFVLLNNDKVPGGSVSEQTPKFHEESHAIFDNRDGRLGVYRE